MYCSVSDVQAILPDSITVGDQNLGTPSPGNSVAKRERLTPARVVKFIRLASQEVDARLGNTYVTPLRMVKTYETELMNNLAPGTNVKIKIWNTTSFAVGDSVRVQAPDTMEITTITTVPDLNTFFVSALAGTYSSDTGKVSIIEVPDPIPLISARLACSYAFDELFSADQSPDISGYGTAQRKLANFAIDGILDGTIRLFGQEHTGWRFVRGTLLDAYGYPTSSQSQFTFGREQQGQ